MGFLRRLAVLVCVLLLPAAARADELGLARLSLIEGDVQVQVQDTTEWGEAEINLPLGEGDRLWVSGDGKAELQIRGGVFARAGADTALDVLTMTADSAQFYLDRGHFYISDRRGGVRTVQVDTPLSSIRSYDNSVMMIDMSEDGVTEVSVLRGAVYAESRAGSTRVTAGNTLTIRGEESAEISPIGSPDEWERWNMDRDRLLYAGGESSRYLPDELHEYAPDFDNNGRWQYAAEYGYIWTPVNVMPSWTPYSAGRWTWIRGQYVWIAEEPWCWTPCHYGRWVYIPSVGWSWVPPTTGAAYWGPGFVGWVVAPSYVAWVPLAPGEIYYSYGYYGPWSTNVAAIAVSPMVTNRIYVNARVHNSVVTVQRESFGTGRHRPVKIGENPFLETVRRPSGDISIVPPRVRPQRPAITTTRETPEPNRRRPPEPTGPQREVHENLRVPAPPATTPPVVQRPAGQRTLPPERYRRIRPEELKNERRLIKDRDASVFKAAPPENLPVRKTREPRVIIRKPVPQQPGVQTEQKKKKQEEGGDRRFERER